MTRRFGLDRLAPAAVIAAALAVMGALLSGSLVSAQQEATIDGGEWYFDVASTGNVVEIKFTGVPSAGLGAADITVEFDSAVVKITGCDPGDLDGACNPNAPGGPARAAGFAAPAITTGPVVIAALTVECVGVHGTETDLTITVNELVDGTAGDPQPIPASIVNGEVGCGEPEPPILTVAPARPATGGAPGDSSGSSPGWAIPLAVSLGAIALGIGTFGAWRLRRWI